MKPLHSGLVIAFSLALLLLTSATTLHAANPVIVHEWGTFTSLQDENGKAIGGINVDDEPVPSFVYGMGYVHSLPGSGGASFGFGLPPYPPQKGWRPADQDVTMRLETPVIYFYPPKGSAPSSALPLNVRVDFHGGLLSQFYPYAETNGFPDAFPINQPVHLADCTSGLTWTVTHFGSAQLPVQTSDKVWTMPREVSAPEIEVKAKTWDPSGNQVDTAQAEHFLFYRGVGHLDSPIMIAQDGGVGKGAMEMGTQTDALDIDSAWIVQIQPDGKCAWRAVEGQGVIIDGTERIPVKTLHAGFSSGGISWYGNFSANFIDANFSAANLGKLKASMQDTLMKEGLYPDEASAMLRTWELSYFKSPGLRFFYIVPRAWVDKTLPLTITGAAVQVTRVMVGRIELISDEQKATLARMQQEAYPNLMDLKQAAYDAVDNGKYSKQEKDAFYSGARPLTDLDINLSSSVRDYLSLGRFRDALIVHEQAEHPSENLARFIKENRLAAR